MKPYCLFYDFSKQNYFGERLTLVCVAVSDCSHRVSTVPGLNCRKACVFPGKLAFGYRCPGPRPRERPASSLHVRPWVPRGPRLGVGLRVVGGRRGPRVACSPVPGAAVRWAPRVARARAAPSRPGFPFNCYS